MAEAKPVPTVVTHAPGTGPAPSAPAAVPPAPATGNGFIFVLSGPS